MNQLTAWLNSNSTKNLLNVPTDLEWINCNDDVYDAFLTDIMTSMTPLMSLVLENIDVMIYSGQDDLICNLVGTQAFMEKFNWKYI